jgi:hypothetical protein
VSKGSNGTKTPVFLFCTNIQYGRRGRGSGRQGAKYRSTNQQLRMPREWARSSSAFNFRVAAFKFRVEKAVRFHHRSPVTSHRSPQFYVQPSSGFCWIPPCSAASFEVNSELKQNISLRYLVLPGTSRDQKSRRNFTSSVLVQANFHRS